jgi:hypothetical protein
MSNSLRYKARGWRGFKVVVHLRIFAPDEELAKGGEGYGTLFRALTLPFAPYPSLALHFDNGSPLETDPDGERWNELFDKLNGVTTIFEVTQVMWDVTDRQFEVTCTHFEPTLEKFRTYIEFMTEFANFKTFDEFF